MDFAAVHTRLAKQAGRDDVPWDMDSFTLAFVGAAYGTSLAVGFSLRARRLRSPADAWMASIVLCGIVAVITIVLQHRISGDGVLFLETLEYAATLTVGPLLLLYIRAITGSESTVMDRLHFAPALAALAAPAIADQPVLGAPIELLITHQIVYTILAARRFLTHETIERNHRFWGISTLCLMACTHLAQVVRLVWSAASRIENIVPVILSIGTLVIGAAAGVWLLTSEIRSFGRRRPKVDSLTGNDSQLREIAERARKAIAEEHLYRDSSLSLADLSRIIETSPHELSRAINESLDESFHTLLRHYRLDDAKRRLRDPSHDVFTIEGIGQMSGFGSRSTFHDLFRKETGMSPAEFRRRGGR